MKIQMETIFVGELNNIHSKLQNSVSNFNQKINITALLQIKS